VKGTVTGCQIVVRAVCLCVTVCRWKGEWQVVRS